MSRSSNDLKTLVAAMPLAGCQRLLDLMCIQQGTGLSEESARQRVLTAVMGRPARQRNVWLDFFVTALEAYARYHIDNWDEFSVDDLDVSVMDDEDYWDDVHTEILDQYLGNIRGVTSQLLPKFLPFNLLADLEYESDGDPVTFKLSALFVWPNASQLQSVVGDGAWIAGGSRGGSGLVLKDLLFLTVTELTRSRPPLESGKSNWRICQRLSRSLCEGIFQKIIRRVRRKHCRYPSQNIGFQGGSA
jgi:hypothetical protein